MTENNLVEAGVECLIEKLLKELEIDNGTIIGSPFDTHGNNYMGIVTQMKVKGLGKQNQTVELNLVAKSAPKTSAYRSLFPIHESYKREIYIYSRLFPEMEKLQKGRNVLKPFNSYPRYYAGVTDEPNEALILENMLHLGYRTANPVEPLDLDHLLLVIKEYGKFHALSFALRHQKPKLFEAICSNTQDIFFQNSKNEFYENGRQTVCEKALSCLDPVTHDIIYVKYKTFQAKVEKLCDEVVKPDAAGKYGVITHGDCWINNLLFKYKDSTNPKHPTNVCLLDWQVTRLASPALDISYFLFTCSDKAVREKHYDHLIQEYYCSLSLMVRELGSDPEELFPYHVLQDHLKKFSCFGLYMSLLTLFLVFSQGNKSKDCYNAATESDVRQSFYYKMDENNYHNRVRSVILDFFKYGYDWST